MKPETAQQYIGMTCRIHYEILLPSWKQNDNGDWEPYKSNIPFIVTGVITGVGAHKVTALAFDGEDCDFEFYPKLENIKRIYELKT